MITTTTVLPHSRKIEPIGGQKYLLLANSALQIIIPMAFECILSNKWSVFMTEGYSKDATRFLHLLEYNECLAFTNTSMEIGIGTLIFTYM